MACAKGLGLAEAPALLLARGWIGVEEIVAGELVVKSARRRNRNLRVERARGAGYLLKEPDPGEHGGEQTLRLEASFYTLCQRERRARRLAAFLPRLLHFDSEAPRLTLELVPGASSLWGELEARIPEGLATTPHALLGKALGRLRSTFALARWADHPIVGEWRRDPPWVLSIHHPDPRALSFLTASQRQTLHILQREEELGTRLEALGKRWQVEALIHGDVKSDNVLVAAGERPGDTRALLIDWETVQWGDPAWDVAAVLQDLLAFWIFSLPFEPALGLAQRAAQARYPLGVLKPLFAAFWRSYRRAANLDPAAATALLGRAVPFSAARLTQTAFELGRGFPNLPAPSVLMLQVASNILANPVAAAHALYGLDGS